MSSIVDAEDLSVFFDGFECVCAAGGHTFAGLLNEPQQVQSFDEADLMVSNRTVTAPSADVALAGLGEGDQLAVTARGATRQFVVRMTVRGGDAALTRIELGAQV